MAKSLRSKWRRKMRAVKRERYGEKENAKLIQMLTAAGEYPQIEGVKLEVEEMSSKQTPTSDPAIARQLGITKARKRTPRPRAVGRKSRRDHAADDEAEADVEDIDDEEMESEGETGDGDTEEGMSVDKPNHIFSNRSMRDQFGNYPAWMNKRKMKTQQKKNKRIAKRRALSVAGKRIRKLK